MMRYAEALLEQEGVKPKKRRGRTALKQLAKGALLTGTGLAIGAMLKRPTSAKLFGKQTKSIFNPSSVKHRIPGVGQV